VQVGVSGPILHFTRHCWDVIGDTTGPVAYTPKGGILPSMDIEGCADPNVGHPELSLSESAISAPGDDPAASAIFRDENGTVWGTAPPTSPASVTLTHYEEVGGVVEGSFLAKVTHPGAAADLVISGQFRVCHVQDVPKP
jgi:hypothetical protein